jgi:hypothetical protein
VNSDFEQPAQGEKIPHWTGEAVEGAAVSLEAHGQGHALRLQPVAEQPDYSAHAASEPIATSGGPPWTLSVLARSSQPGEQTLRLGLELRTDRGVEVKNREIAAVEGKWTRHEFVLDDLPADVREVRCLLAAHGVGEVWIDDVELTRLNRTEEERARLHQLWITVDRHLTAGRLESARKILDSSDAKAVLTERPGLGGQLPPPTAFNRPPANPQTRIMANAKPPVSTPPPVAPVTSLPEEIRVSTLPQAPKSLSIPPQPNKLVPQDLRVHSQDSGPVVRIGTPAPGKTQSPEPQLERLPPVEK